MSVHPTVLIVCGLLGPCSVKVPAGLVILSESRSGRRMSVSTNSETSVVIFVASCSDFG